MSKRDREELLYLRPEDLDDAEKAERDALIAESDRARRLAAEVDQLDADLDAIGHTDEGPSFDRLLAALDGDARRDAPEPTEPDTDEPDTDDGPDEDDADEPANNTRYYWIGALVALAAALLLVPLLRGDPYRDKGHGGTTARVTLEAVAEGPDGAVRPLSDGASVAPTERVVFFVTATEPGVVRLTEGGVDLLGAAWRVDAGRQAPGGDQPLAYRPDAPIEGARYGVQWCPDADAFGTDACVSDALTLQWAP